MVDASPVRAPNVAELVGSFANRRVLVVGDLVLDEYLVGRAARLSREAPVPVLELIERFSRLGAAANPAVNVSALGGRPILVGVVGEDAAGDRLLRELDAVGVDAAGVIRSPDRTTAIKTRVLARNASAHPQQVARIDDVPSGPLTGEIERQLVERLRALLPAADAVLVSNYRAGVVSRAITQAVVDLATRHRVPTCVDTQGSLSAFHGFTLVKSNHPDAEAALGTELRVDADYARAGERLIAELGAEAVVITRGGEGISLIEATGQCSHLPPTNRTDVWDVTGAGDTVIAVLALGLGARADLIATTQLANAAAGLVVQRIGVASVTPDELAAALGQTL